MRLHVLIVDDDVDICTLLQRYLDRKGFVTDIAFSAKEAFNKLKKKSYDVIFCDYRLGDKDGLEVLNGIKSTRPDTEVVIITAYSDIKMAVNLIKSGAYDYMSKPIVPEELLNIAHKALEHSKHKSGQNPSSDHSNTESGGAPLKERQSLEDHIFEGSSQTIQNVYDQVGIVAPTDYSILLHGESGSGKEIIAKLIHRKSNRGSGPFVALDCGTLSRELANSELFGHLKGAFTGAITDKKGHFEMANGGTLFLDEIANLSYDIQASLLRVLQEKKVKRIGGTKEIKLDVRIIVASHENLRKAYQQKRFREDLYHRLNEFAIKIPSLRNRKEDIPAFASFFLKQTNKETGKQIEGFEEEVMDKFLHYSWPGNIRELRNVIRKAVLLTPSERITTVSLSPELLAPSDTTDSLETVEKNEQSSGDHFRNTDLKKVSMEVEYQTIIEVLDSVNFNKTKAAKILNIDRKTLYNKLKEYDG